MNGPLPGLHASTHLPQAGAPSLRQDSACDNQIRSGQRLRELITLLNGAEINTLAESTSLLWVIYRAVRLNGVIYYWQRRVRRN